MPRRAGSSRSATSRRSRPCDQAGTGSIAWHARFLDRETLDEDEAYAAAGISRETAPVALSA